MTHPSQPPKRPGRFHAFHNWLSLGGLILVLASLFAFFLLFVVDALAHFSNPYVGILMYLVAPFFLITGLAVMMFGAWHRRRQLVRAGTADTRLQIDLSRPRDRRFAVAFLAAGVGFLLLTAVGSYQTYHFTESVQFCGQACHTIMKPEFVTYEHSPHARLSCTECHIGPGAAWYVRMKLSGMYQVYATLTDRYPRPIPTPIKNLRPARITCEQCHWPKQFVGDTDRTFVYFLDDQTNTYHAIRMLLKVGGGEPTEGPVGGIHWHMSVANKIEYIATDKARQTIPWVRLTDPQGIVTVYRSPGFTNDLGGYEMRVMDCMDCHNRPAHNFKSPNDAVNLALRLGRIDPALPWIKTNAEFALTQPYTNQTQALEGIATTLARAYPDATGTRQAIRALQQIYTNNFFPSMKTDWRDYPDNLGHKDWPGCTRCHDDQHVSADGKEKIPFSDCTGCHVILAQGSPEDLLNLNARGQPFQHPGGEIPEGFQCTDCHTGGP